jgi:hypothetical protein
MSKTPLKPPPNDLYETDFYAWARQQAKLLRERRWDDLDLANLVEEVDHAGRSQRHEIESRLRVLMTHLLKWRYQPGIRSGSWRNTMRDERFRIELVVKDSPSLKRHPAKAYSQHYDGARLDASEETGIAYELFPEECLFTIEQILDPRYWPQEPDTPST